MAKNHVGGYFVKKASSEGSHHLEKVVPGPIFTVSAKMNIFALRVLGLEGHFLRLTPPRKGCAGRDLHQLHLVALRATQTMHPAKSNNSCPSMGPVHVAQYFGRVDFPFKKPPRNIVWSGKMRRDLGNGPLGTAQQLR